jgi:hypothetical protein
MMGNKSIAEVEDDTLYQLLDVESKFGIHSIDLIERASRQEEPLLKLCLPLPDGCNIYIVDTAFIWGYKSNTQSGGSTLPDRHARDRIMIPIKQKVIALVLSPNSCDEIRCVASAKVSMFNEAYCILKDSRKKPVSGSFSVMKPIVEYPAHHDSNRVDVGRLRFGKYSTHERKDYGQYGYQAPDSFTISRNDLYIYGSELKRFMAEVDVGQFSSDEQQGDDEPKAEQNKKPNAILKAQASLRILMDEVEKRASENNLPITNDEWPGVKEDFVALVLAWADRHKEYRHLIKASLTIQDYLKGMIRFSSGSRQTNFYLDLFPEFEVSILKYRDGIKNKPKTKG